MDSMSADVIRKMAQFDAQALTNTAWSYAKLSNIPPRVLNPLIEQAFQKLPQWCPQNLTALSWSFAALTFRSRTLMGSISEEVIQKITACCAQDLSNTSWAYAKLAIVHYTMLDSISTAAMKTLYDFTAQNLTNTAWAWATLAVHNIPLFTAIAAEANGKISDFCAQNLGNIAWAFALLVVVDLTLLNSISAEAIKNIAGYDMQDLSWLADFPLQCAGELQSRLDKEISLVWNIFPSTEKDVNDIFLQRLWDLRVDNLGAVGNRQLLSRMGASMADPSLERRALQVILEHREEDPHEDPSSAKFGGPTRHKRVFSYAEYQINFGMGASLIEGAIVQENGARTSNSQCSPLRAVPLPINRRVERSACSEFLLLSELCVEWSRACKEHHCTKGDIYGTLRLYSTGPSCMSCLAALWQFRLCYPGVDMEVDFTMTQDLLLFEPERDS